MYIFFPPCVVSHGVSIIPLGLSRSANSPLASLPPSCRRGKDLEREAEPTEPSLVLNRRMETLSLKERGGTFLYTTPEFTHPLAPYVASEPPNICRTAGAILPRCGGRGCVTVQRAVCTWTAHPVYDPCRVYWQASWVVHGGRQEQTAAH